MCQQEDQQPQFALWFFAAESGNGFRFWSSLRWPQECQLWRYIDRRRCTILLVITSLLHCTNSWQKKPQRPLNGRKIRRFGHSLLKKYVLMENGWLHMIMMRKKHCTITAHIENGRRVWVNHQRNLRAGRQFLQLLFQVYTLAHTVYVQCFIVCVQRSNEIADPWKVCFFRIRVCALPTCGLLRGLANQAPNFADQIQKGKAEKEGKVVGRVRHGLVRLN